VGGGDVLGPRAVGRDPRRPGPGPGQPGHPGTARRCPQGPHRGVRRQGGRRRGVAGGSGRRHQGRDRGDHRFHRGGQGRSGRRPGAVRHDVQAVRTRPAAGAQPERLRARAAGRRRPRRRGVPPAARRGGAPTARARRGPGGRRRGPCAAPVDARRRLAGRAGRRVGHGRRGDRRHLRLGPGARGRGRDGGDRVAGAHGDARPRAVGHRACRSR